MHTRTDQASSRARNPWGAVSGRDLIGCDRLRRENVPQRAGPRAWSVAARYMVARAVRLPVARLAVLAALFVFTLRPPALAQPAAGVVEGVFAVRFEASSTLHDFAGEAPPVPFRAEPEPGRSGRWKAVVELPVRSLHTGIERRDRNMRQMFEADRYPVIRAVLRDLPAVDLRPPPHGRGKLRFDLTIRDVTRTVVATVAEWHEDGNRYAFEVRFPVSLADFGLDPPGFLFVRVGDRVEVQVAVRATLRSEPHDSGEGG